jgi:hypothetical protein
MSLEQTVDNLEIRYANAVTFVGTSNTMIDTTTGRIQTKGIQHNSNVITDVSGPHGRVAPTLKKYPEIAFEDTSKMDMGEGGTDGGLIFKQAGYTITASSTHPTNGRVPYRAFNGDHTSGWICASSSWNSGTDVYQGGRGIGGYDGEWIKLELPHKIKVETMYIEADLHSGRRPLTGKLLGSDDDSSWAIIKDLTSIPNQNKNTLNIGSTVAYKYIAFLTETIPSGNDTVWIDEIEYYGYEEYTPAGDHSVDTTFMSRFNNPQLTGVQVLVDGATGQGTNQISGGPDPSGNQSTMTSHNKYWTLNGTLTSNLSVEANTFLSGDQPHAVSVWFNSSNLEANVSNTCVFSVSDQEKLDSVNLDLQSNTWHNLTYAYQGEGGSRVTYLDGRKVAEDQAEDTFGEYPPFAMTGYSQGGYVVSASGEYPGTSYLAHEAFNGTVVDNGDCWLSTDSTYDATTGNYNGNANLGSDSGGPAFANADKGEWLKLEMPHKFVLDYITICGSTSTAVNPKDWKIYGSNDDKNWDVLLSKTNAVTVAYNATSGKEHNVGATKAYKYFALVVIKSGGLTSGTHYIQVSELEYYGHRENDLVRLPDPTNVLKYPHIVFPNSDGPAGQGPNATPSIRGYVATSDDPNPTLYPIGKAFDGIFSDPTGGNINNQARWQPFSGTYPNDGTDTTSGATTTLANGTTYKGNYMQLESPHKLNVTKYKIYSGTFLADYRPIKVVMLGSNTGGSDWVDLGSGETTLTYSGTNADYAGTVSVSNTSAYKYHRLVIRAVAAETRPVVYQLELYGTGVDSIPIQIGGGNIDKVANFRVYDKFVGEDQALEIWDAQKDEFGRAKSSMTLQKGRLGIGTTEPQGRLAVLDEPHNLEEFPPRVMTDYKTYFEGHGEFRVSASSNHPTYRPWYAFDGETSHVSNDNSWISGTDALYDNASTGLPTSIAARTNVNGGDLVGEWIQMSFPYKIHFKQVALAAQTDTEQYRAPKDATIAGSNDGVTWDTLHTFTNQTSWTDNQYNYYTMDGNVDKAYKYVRIIIQKVQGNSTYTSLAEVKFFGTREQGQSVLHDGQLTLTKNLNVPRIGPALDADDTPRRDRLVVEYNTSTNPTFEGAVRDTSGRGNDGVFVGTASYDATEKAFVTPNTTGIIRKNINLPGGNIPLSVSAWFRLIDTTTSTNDTIICLGTNSDATSGGSFILLVNTDRLSINFEQSDNYTEFTKTIYNGTWYHVVATYDGGTSASARKLFIDGVEIAQTSTVGTITGVNLAANPDFTVGMRTDISGYINGSISNFKLYDTVLTTEEVKTLYDMGRTGHIVNPQPLHITAPLYLPSTTFPNYKFYEEGEFVPYFGAVTAPTYTEQFGRYTKIGNVVFVHIMITYSGLNTLDASGVHIGGIPFHTDGTNTNCALVSYHGDFHNMFSPVNGAGARVDGDTLLLSHSSDGNYVNYNECIADGRLNMVAQYFIP